VVGLQVNVEFSGLQARVSEALDESSNESVILSGLSRPEGL